MDWNDLRFFLAVSRKKSLTGAAVSLNSTPSTVARRIGALEGSIGTPLFIRSQQGYELTDAGGGLVDRAESVEAAVHDLERTAGEETSGDPEGAVRVSLPENLAQYALIPLLPGFWRDYPKIRLQLLTGPQTVNLTRRDADIALRTNRPTTGRFLVRKLGEFSMDLYATSDCPTEQIIGWDETLGDLPSAHALVLRMGNVAPRLTTNSVQTQMAAASVGIGAALLPKLMADLVPDLELREESIITQDIWLVVHEDLRHSARVSAVADYIYALFDSA